MTSAMRAIEAVVCALSVLPSGTLARSASTYATLDDAIREAGAQLKKGFAVDAWI